jgi:hypothetical protein
MVGIQVSTRNSGCTVAWGYQVRVELVADWIRSVSPDAARIGSC